MEELLGREESLQVCDEEERARVVESRKFVVQFGVEHVVGPLGLFEGLSRLGDLALVALLGAVAGRRLQRLVAVTLPVEIHQFASSLINFFLKNRLKHRLTLIGRSGSKLNNYS